MGKMIISIPDKHLNSIQRDSMERLIKDAKGMHYATLHMRINGEDRMFEVDWFKHAELHHGYMADDEEEER